MVLDIFGWGEKARERKARQQAQEQEQQLRNRFQREVLNEYAEQPVVVYFWNQGPDGGYLDIVRTKINKLRGIKLVPFVIEEAHVIASQYGIQRGPTVLAKYRGHWIVRKDALLSAQGVEKFLDELDANKDSWLHQAKLRQLEALDKRYAARNIDLTFDAGALIDMNPDQPNQTFARATAEVIFPYGRLAARAVGARKDDDWVLGVTLGMQNHYVRRNMSMMDERELEIAKLIEKLRVLGAGSKPDMDMAMWGLIYGGGNCYVQLKQGAAPPMVDPALCREALIVWLNKTMPSPQQAANIMRKVANNLANTSNDPLVVQFLREAKF